MVNSALKKAAPPIQGGAAMLENKVRISPTLTPELDQAFETFCRLLPSMIRKGWGGKWVAISGDTILGHNDRKKTLAVAFKKLYSEKKLLLRVVRNEPKLEYSGW